jgi:hypothetical protein
LVDKDPNLDFMDSDSREKLSDLHLSEPRALPGKDALANLERLRIRDSVVANAIKNYIDGTELISPQMKSIIDQQKKLIPNITRILIIKEKFL